MNKNLVIVGILVLLVLIAAVQTFQMMSIKNNLNEIGSGKVVKKTSSGSSSTSGQASVPTNLQNLPGMVGGC
ncbi:hypothetical protein J4456_04750 [Candidatus Pacearchaeota archaeon]|nr:hypothetical protein [Candidatus Pacearchaeota archaeon]